MEQRSVACIPSRYVCIPLDPSILPTLLLYCLCLQGENACKKRYEVSMMYALVAAGNMASWLLVARHVHSMLHWLALEACNGPWHSTAAHSLYRNSCFPSVPALQAPQESTEITCPPTLGVHLQKLQVPTTLRMNW